MVEGLSGLRINEVRNELIETNSADNDCNEIKGGLQDLHITVCESDKMECNW